MPSDERTPCWMPVGSYKYRDAHFLCHLVYISTNQAIVPTAEGYIHYAWIKPHRFNDKCKLQHDSIRAEPLMLYSGQSCEKESPPLLLPQEVTGRLAARRR